MKKLAILFVAVGAFAFSAKKTLNEGMAIGTKAPMASYKMMDISGQEMSLEDVKDDNGLLVIFSCNTCPFVIGWEDQYPKLGKLAKKHNIGMVLVNSNEAKRSGEDSMEEMKMHAKNAGYNTPYVVDKDAALANAFQANTTPHVYLFDAEMKLVFTGSINNKYEQKNKKATTSWLEDAMNKLAKGQAGEIEPAVTKNIGCSIKRK